MTDVRTRGPAPDGADEPDALDRFWQDSSHDRMRASAVAARLAAYDGTRADPHLLTPPGPARALRPVRDRCQRLLGARRSGRSFGGRPLRHRQVERLLAAVGPTRDGRRTVPEAGGIDAVHAYALVRRARGPLDGTVLRYDHRRHAVHPICRVPADDEVRALFRITGDLPQLVVVLAADVDAVVAKYGARGARFALQQVGHAAQNIGLRLAADRMTGHLLGGGLDREVLGLLRIAHTGVRYGGAVACGR